MNAIEVAAKVRELLIENQIEVWGPTIPCPNGSAEDRRPKLEENIRLWGPKEIERSGLCTTDPDAAIVWEGNNGQLDEFVFGNDEVAFLGQPDVQIESGYGYMVTFYDLEP